MWSPCVLEVRHEEVHELARTVVADGLTGQATNLANSWADFGCEKPKLCGLFLPFGFQAIEPKANKGGMNFSV